MTPRAPRRRTKAVEDPFPEAGLAELGLAPGDVVRFRKSDGERWKEATVVRRERDGSVGLADGRGAARSIPVECIEARDVGPRGGTVWEPLPERAARTEQLALVREQTARPRPAGRVRGRSGTGPDPDDEVGRREAERGRTGDDEGGAEQLPLL